MRGLWRQGRFSVRALLKAPAFTWSAVLLVGVGVGAVTTIFTLVDHVLLRPLPYPDADRLVLVENGSHSGPLFNQMKQMSTVDEWGAAWDESATLVGEGEPLRLRAARVSRDFFRIFGARAVQGRLLTEEDFTTPDATVIVDGHAWRRIWNSDPDLVGRTINLDGQPVTVVGITNPDFVPPEAEVGSEVDFWRPLDWSSDMLTSHTAWVLSVVGRVAPGSSVEAVSQEMQSVMARMAPVHENYRNRDDEPRELPITPLGEVTVRGVRAGLGLLLGAVVMLLLVACANVAQLFLARGLGRHREMAVRRALGAGTAVLMGQLLWESLLVGLAGGALGVVLGWVGLRGFLRLSPDALPRQESVMLDPRVLAFAAAVSVATALVFGLLPAVRSVRGEVADELRGSGRSATAGRGTGLLRSGLVIGEVALSLVLMAGAGLLLRSFLLVHAQDPGFRTDRVWTVPLSLTSIDTPEAWMQTMEGIDEAVARVPGVESTTFGLTMPLTSGGGRCCWRSTVTAEADATETPMIHPVTPAYFETLGIPLQAGRIWSRGEAEADPAPVVVSKGLAVALWGSAERAVNQPLEMNSFAMTVVGVVGDVRHYGLEHDPDPAPLRAGGAAPLPHRSGAPGGAPAGRGGPLLGPRAPRGRVERRPRRAGAGGALHGRVARPGDLEPPLRLDAVRHLRRHGAPAGGRRAVRHPALPGGSAAARNGDPAGTGGLAGPHRA